MGRAVVVGGSIAGMCAARALCDVFDEVVLLDRDHYPELPRGRAGVSQSRHAHALLARGQRELETLFPGFTEAMIRGGALKFDAGLYLATRRKQGWQDVGEGGIDTIWASRDLLEFTVRALLRQQTRVELREGVHVTGFARAPGAASGVGGVILRGEAQGGRVLAADLVVDATGRNSRADDWLRAIGVAPPERQVVDSHLGYASRMYKAPSPDQRPAAWWWKGLWIESEPPHLARGGVIFPIEHDRWIVTGAGIDPEYPPTDEAGFVAFFDTLSSPAIAQALRYAEPLSTVCGHRAMANVFRRYEQQANTLRGFIAVGDSVCAFNPIYGQGMSSAAACASILRAVLREHGRGPGFERRFWKRQAEFLVRVWNLAIRADFTWPNTVGERPKVSEPIARYFSLAMGSAHENAELRRHLLPIINLIGPIELFFEPRFMFKVLLHAAKQQLKRRFVGAAPIPDVPPPSPLLRQAW